MNAQIGFLWDSLTPNTGDQAIGTTMLRLATNSGFPQIKPIAIQSGYSSMFELLLIGGGELLHPPGHPYYDAFRVPGEHILSTVGTSGKVEGTHLNDYRLVSVRSNVDRNNIVGIDREVTCAPCVSLLFDDVHEPVEVPKLPADSIGIHLSPAAVDLNTIDGHHLKRLFGELPGQPVFFSFTPYNQDHNLAKVFAHLTGSPDPLEVSGPDHAFSLMRSMQSVLCTSLHATIFAYLAGIPFLSIGYAPKIRHFLEERGLQKRIVADLGRIPDKSDLLRPGSTDWGTSLRDDKRKARAWTDRVFDEFEMFLSQRPTRPSHSSTQFAALNPQLSGNTPTWSEPTHIQAAHQLQMKVYKEYGLRFTGAVSRALLIQEQHALHAAYRRLTTAHEELQTEYRRLERHLEHTKNTYAINRDSSE